MTDKWSDSAFELGFSGVDRGAAATSATALIKVAPTGAKPILAATDDGRRFWLKWPGNPHGNISLVNELVVARVGELLGAPVRPVSLVYVDPALVDGFGAYGDAVPAGIHFGSELLPDVEEATEILRVARDGNSERFPRFLALWTLCLGTDLQLLYQVTNEDQVWSIDHGLWFDTHEGDWTVDLLEAWVDDVWPWPEDERPYGLSSSAMHDVADSVSALTVESLARVVGEVPPQWGIDDGRLKALAKFLHKRRDLIAIQLRAAAAHYS